MVIPQFTLGWPSWEIISLQSNKNTYYNYENMEINASWNLFFEEDDNVFLQIHLMNDSENILWKSPRYSNAGYNEDNWIIHIPNLNIEIDNDTTQMFVKIWISFNNHVASADFYDSEFLTINIIKANVTCELDGFEGSITYGEEISLLAKFFEANNTLLIINTTIRFQIESESIILYQGDYITNQSGIINVNISSIDYLSVGVNNLIFIMISNETYNNYQFSYKLRVEKIPIYGEIININGIDKNEGTIEVLSYFYYYFNESIVPLNNSFISIRLYQKNSLKYTKSLNTNILGVTTFIISLGSINLEKYSTEVNITIIYNGTQYLHDETVSKTIDVNEFIYQNVIDTMEILYLTSFFSSIIVIGFMVANKRRGRDKNLADLCIRI
ncbi:MAG: hypothetical protein KGD73_02915 [Candidatus Lokiarchaeota archaeon]|nr:hypothetical protein [Candidatus Lokiarchaeota archaeon]